MKPSHLALCAAAVFVPAIANAAEEQRVALTPVATKLALDEFARICLNNFPVASKVRSAVERAPGYTAGSVQQGQQWRSSQAVVALVAEGGKASRCEFDAVLTERVEPGVLAGLVQSRLERDLGHRPPYRQVGQSIVWEWDFGGVTRALTIDFSNANRQLALSLIQRRNV